MEQTLYLLEKKSYDVDFSVLLRFPILVKYFSGVPLDRRCLDLSTITTPGKKGLLGIDTLAHFASSSVFKKMIQLPVWSL